ncbi:MAG: TonB-dependent receptor [Rhodoferax sp.]|uniref:TonB-dependent receptor plug domain-containing protein n=1 Tax=Rhodoferax sp. TaxID=50421 RepID=UPI00262E6D17|nr:TonB-dependent receptor [Rhodoferax sp.]MDD5333232.1 TonB-dependent receptor [Rhodoferax sp.]
MFAKTYLVGPPSGLLKGLLLGLSVVAAVPCVQAQTEPREAAKAVDDTAPAAAPDGGPKAGPQTRAAPRRSAGELQRVTVTGTALDETQSRRQATASKIIVGRDDIERFGDSTLGELLKRLPGVTMPGRPGRGGAPRMRGLGGGYTQILIDGEPAPRGFSLDELSPEQIERIEILRAPTAETGARAIAGTINIITRGGYSKKLNDLRVGVGLENGNRQPGLSWTRNDAVGAWIYNFSLSAQHSERKNDYSSHNLTENLVSGELIDQTERTQSMGQRDGMQANARLQWRGDNGDTLVLTPMLLHSQGSSSSSSSLQQTGGVAPYDGTTGSGASQFSSRRLGLQWTHRLEDGGNWLLRANLGQSDWDNTSTRQNFGSGPSVGRFDNQSDQHDLSFSASAKLTTTLANDHSLVGGAELQNNRRRETASTLLDGESPLTEFDGNLTAASLRAALYAQDEWSITPQFAAHAGLRWEGISTQGTPTAGTPDISNRSSVWTPLLHAVWKFDPEGRDQIRASLTRSYRSPNLQDLIARPSINPMFPGRGANDEIHPDRAGNPALKPELASGLDLAIERYLPGSGMLSANLFYRHINNLMRSQTTLETVSWADQPRWVARLQNIGDAITQGLELEAKFRASELWPNAPRVDVRANASLFASRVQGVPAPDNRLSQQPDGTLNLGADYRLRELPLTFGGNLNWTPGYSTRLSDDQRIVQGAKLVLDAFVLWTLSTSSQLRVTLGNLAARDYVTTNTLESSNAAGQALRETGSTSSPSWPSLQVRLELKL